MSETQTVDERVSKIETTVAALTSDVRSLVDTFKADREETLRSREDLRGEVRSLARSTANQGKFSWPLTITVMIALIGFGITIIGFAITTVTATGAALFAIHNGAMETSGELTALATRVETIVKSSEDRVATEEIEHRAMDERVDRMDNQLGQLAHAADETDRDIGNLYSRQQLIGTDCAEHGVIINGHTRWLNRLTDQVTIDIEQRGKSEAVDERHGEWIKAVDQSGSRKAILGKSPAI